MALKLALCFFALWFLLSSVTCVRDLGKGEGEEGNEIYHRCPADGKLCHPPPFPHPPLPPFDTNGLDGIGSGPLFPPLPPLPPFPPLPPLPPFPRPPHIHRNDLDGLGSRSSGNELYDGCPPDGPRCHPPPPPPPPRFDPLPPPHTPPFTPDADTFNKQSVDPATAAKSTHETEEITAHH